jgi:hypothetical protein
VRFITTVDTGHSCIMLCALCSELISCMILSIASWLAHRIAFGRGNQGRQ